MCICIIHNYTQFFTGRHFDYFQSFTITNSATATALVCMCVCVYTHTIYIVYIYIYVSLYFFPVCLCDRFLKVGLLYQRRNALVIMLKIARFFLIEVLCYFTFPPIIPDSLHSHQ